METKVMSFEDYMSSIGTELKDTVSTNKLRDENKQTKVKPKQYRSKKKTAGMKYKLLLETEIALPFDPTTGVTSKEGFNEDNKYRPAISAGHFALALKEYCRMNESLKNILMKKSGTQVWDLDDYTDISRAIAIVMNTSAQDLLKGLTPVYVKLDTAKESVIAQVEEKLAAYNGSLNQEKKDLIDKMTFTKCLTDVDKQVFKPFIVPRVLTVSLVGTSLKDMLPKGFTSIEYMVTIKRNRKNEIVEYNEQGEEIPAKVPSIIRIYDFQSAVNMNKIKDYRDAQEKLPADKRDNEEAQKKVIQEIFAANNLVSDDRPANFIPAMWIPIDTSYAPVKNDIFDPVLAHNYESKDFIKNMIFLRKNKKFSNAIDDVLSSTSNLSSLDYIELDVSIPSTSTTPGQMGIDSTISAPKVSMSNTTYGVEFNEAFSNFINSETDIEETFLNSIKFKPYTSDIDTALLAAYANEYDITSEKFLTDDILVKHGSVIYELYGDMPEAEEIITKLAELNEDEETDSAVISAETRTIIEENYKDIVTFEESDDAPDEDSVDAE